MSYLLTQMFLYMLATFVLGLLIGWLLWRYGQASREEFDRLKSEHGAMSKERDDMRTNLDACRARSAQERETLEALRGDKIDLQNRLDAMIVERDAALSKPASVTSISKVTPIAATAPAAFTGTASKPEGLSGPRGGRADDLQRINGVGPKLELLLHDLGYYHFDQIGAWSRAEVAWVDDNLEGFKGRVTRDNWISQAKELAKG